MRRETIAEGEPRGRLFPSSLRATRSELLLVCITVAILSARMVLPSTAAPWATAGLGGFLKLIGKVSSGD